ncbi:hypothetical protein JHK87_012315 [Glycine soja]|nr:hypothetical protein JHK87_012315 [Glycine soja]
MMNLKLKSFEKWDAPEENSRERRKGRLEFFSEKENQETQQPHPREGNVPEKNPHCVALVLPEKDAGGQKKLVDAAQHRVEKTMKRKFQPEKAERIIMLWGFMPRTYVRRRQSRILKWHRRA